MASLVNLEGSFFTFKGKLMATLLTPTTELEAVNVCLANIGESPVSSITGNTTVDAALARDLVRQVTRETQTHGFYWNTELGYTLIPNVSDNLVLPANVLNVDTTQDDKAKDLVARGRLMYDRVNHTYTFTESVKVDTFSSHKQFCTFTVKSEKMNSISFLLGSNQRPSVRILSL